MYVCVCMCVCVYLCVWVCVCACAWEMRVGYNVRVGLFSSYFTMYLQPCSQFFSECDNFHSDFLHIYGVTSFSHVCDWTVSGAGAPYMCVLARVCASLREPCCRYTKAELLSLTKPYVCSSECSAVSLISTFSALIRRYQRHKT